MARDLSGATGVLLKMLHNSDCQWGLTEPAGLFVPSGTSLTSEWFQPLAVLGPPQLASRIRKMSLLNRLRQTLAKIPWLRQRPGRWSHPRRKLAFHHGAYRNLAAEGTHQPGCNLVGFAHGEFGIGQHLRGVAAACEAVGLPFSIHNYSRTLHRQEDHSLDSHLDPGNPHRANLFCLNADSVLDLYDSDRRLFEGRYNIGYGFWELSDFPDAWLPVMNVLDEIWAPSRYVQQVLSEKTAVPVLHMPLAVDFEVPGRYHRKDFGLGADQRVFLFTFDFSSRIRRKNPRGLVEAFNQAFPAARRDVTLVLKCKTVDSVADQVADGHRLAKSVRDDPRIVLINETWPRNKVLDLIQCADVYASLHRAEGFGLGMAEAMKMGKPVIATDYSGNTDFTLPDNACLVGFSLIDVKAGENYDLEGSSVWAEPDVAEAAEHMRYLASDPAAAVALGAKGRRHIEQFHSPRTVGDRYRRRLRRIGLL